MGLLLRGISASTSRLFLEIVVRLSITLNLELDSITLNLCLPYLCEISHVYSKDATSICPILTKWFEVCVVKFEVSSPVGANIRSNILYIYSTYLLLESTFKPV